VAIPVSKPKRNVPIAANRAIPKVYNSPIVEVLSEDDKGYKEDEMNQDSRRTNNELDRGKRDLQIVSS
jgi:hypothetical protein